MNEGFSAQRGVQAFPSYDFADTKSFSGWEVRQRNTEQDRYAQSCTVPWTHFLELAALRTVVATSPVEAKLADWRAGSLASGALVGSWDVADNSIETKKQDVLTGMKWERVLSAEVDIGLKLSLWKSQARARRQQEHWNVGNAVLSLDFERSAAKAQAFSPEVARKNRQPASFQSTVRLRDNTVPGRGDVGRGGERMKNLDRSGEPWNLKARQVSETPRDKVASYTRDIVRVAEPDALTVGNKILLDMIRKGVHPTTIFFNALLAACTGKSVASGVGRHDSRGSSPASTAIGADGSRRGAGGGLSAFTVRRRASTGASRASAAAGWGRGANQRWSDCRQVLLLMKTYGIAPDTATLNVLVDACVKQGGRGRSEAAHVEQALRVLNAFSTTAGVAPDVITYTSLVTGCASALRDCPQSAALPGHRDAERVRSVVRVAAHVLEKMAASDIAPNAVTCTTALDLGVYIILRSPPGSDAQEHGRILCQNIIVLLREVPGGGRGGQVQRSLTFALNIVLRALVRQQGAMSDCVASQLVLNVVESLLDEGAVPDIITYNTLLHRLLLPQQKTSRLEVAAGVDSRRTVDRRRIVDSRPIGVASGASTLHAEVWPAANEHSQRAVRAKELLEHMNTSGISPDIASYTTLLNICATSASRRADFVASARLIFAAMRRSNTKPNAATSAAFAAGLLTTGWWYEAGPPRQVRDAHDVCDATETEPEDTDTALHAVGKWMRDRRMLEAKARNGPGSAELMCAMLALNMRPDSGTCSVLMRATASRAHGKDTAEDGGKVVVKECLRVMEVMRGAGAVASRDWYLETATAAQTVTSGLYVARLTRHHLNHAGIEGAVCEQLVRSFCRRRDFDGIAQGWAVVLRLRAAGQRVRPNLLTLLLETARFEASQAAAQLSLKLLTALDRDSTRNSGPSGKEETGRVAFSRKAALVQVPQEARDVLLEVLLAAGMQKEAQEVREAQQGTCLPPYTTD